MRGIPRNIVGLIIGSCGLDQERMEVARLQLALDEAQAQNAQLRDALREFGGKE